MSLHWHGATRSLALTLLWLGLAGTAKGFDGCIEPVSLPKVGVPKVSVGFVGQHGELSVYRIDGDYRRENAAARMEVSREHLARQRDRFDFLIAFTDFDFPMGEAAAFYNSVRNDVDGIGWDRFDHSAAFGSDGVLQGYIDMGNMARWSFDPTEPAFESTLSVLAHELMHRWGIVVRYRDAEGTVREDLIGRDASHWSYYVDSDASQMYGARWRERSDGRFEAIEIRKRYNLHELYLAGLASAEEVPDLRLLPPAGTPATAIPALGALTAGPPQNISIASIQAAMGPRVPASNASQRHFRVGLLLLTRGNDADIESQQQLERLRLAFESYFRAITDGRATLSIEAIAPADIPQQPPQPRVPLPAPPRGDSEAWLRSQQHADGSWYDHPSTQQRDTAFAIAALRQIDPDHPSLQAARAWLDQAALRNSDQRWWRLLAGSDAQSTATLPVANPDGGFGVVPGWASGLYDTSLGAIGQLRGDGDVSSQTLDALLAAQNPDGGFGFVQRGASRQRSGLFAASVIARRAGSDAAQQRFRDWLSAQGPLSQRSSELGQRGRVIATVELLWRASELQLPPATRAELIRTITDARGPAGDLAGSVYATALASLALAAEGGANLRFVDARLLESRLPRGAPLRLQLRIENAGGAATPASLLRLNAGEGLPAIDLPIPPLAPGDQRELLQWLENDDWPPSGQLQLQLDAAAAIAETDEADNRRVLDYHIDPRPGAADAAVFGRDVTADPALIAGLPSTVRVRGQLRNLGGRPAQQVLVVLESDHSPPRRLAQIRLDLPAASRTPIELDVVLDEARSWTLQLRIDPDRELAEADETNNQTALRVGLADTVDLELDPASLALSPDPVVLGDDLQFTVTVHNRGSLPISATSLALQREDSAGWSELARIPLQLQPAASSTRSLLWRVDREGEQHFRVIADPDQLLAESDEANNVVARAITVDRSAQPNLAALGGSLLVTPTPLLQAQPFRAVATVRNSGGQSTPPFTVAVYQGDPRIDGRRLGDLRVVEPLASGEQRTLGIDAADYPDAGDAVLYWVVDADNDVVERNEADNLLVLEVEALRAPDLVARPANFVFLPNPPVAGQAVQVELLVENAGEQAAPPSSAQLYAVVDRGSTPIGDAQPVPAIAAGGSQSVSWSWSLPEQTSLRALRVQLDPDNRLREANEDNNQADQPIDLQGGDAFLSERYLSPNGDGVRDSTEAVFRALQFDRHEVVVRNRVGRAVRRLAPLHVEDLLRARWDGRDQRGNLLPDGEYTLQLERDAMVESRAVYAVLDRDRAMPLDALRSKRARLRALPESVNGWVMPPPSGQGHDHQAYTVGSGANQHASLRRGIGRSNVLYGGAHAFLDGRWLDRHAQRNGLRSAEVAQIRFSADGRRLHYALVEETSAGLHRTSIWTSSPASLGNASAIGQLPGRHLAPLLAALPDGRLLVGDGIDPATLRLIDPQAATAVSLRGDLPVSRLRWAGPRGLLFGASESHRSIITDPLIYAPLASSEALLTVWQPNNGREVLLDWRHDDVAERVYLHVRDLWRTEERVELVDLTARLRLPVHRREGLLPEASDGGLVPRQLTLRWNRTSRELAVIDAVARALYRYDDKGALLHTRLLPGPSRIGRYAGTAAADDSGYGGGYGYGYEGSQVTLGIRPAPGGLPADAGIPRCAVDVPTLVQHQDEGSVLAPDRRRWGDGLFTTDALNGRSYVSLGELVIQRSAGSSGGYDGYGYGDGYGDNDPGAATPNTGLCTGAVDFLAVHESADPQRIAAFSGWPLEDPADQSVYPLFPGFPDERKAAPPMGWPRFIHSNGTTLFRDGRVQRADNWFVERAFALSGNLLAAWQDEGRLAFSAEPVDSLGAVSVPPVREVLSTLGRLTADLQVESDGRRVRLWGVASDANFAGYRIEWAPVDQPDLWRLVVPQTGSEVFFDEFASWAPPTVGAFLFRLSVEDKAGNRAHAYGSASVDRAAPLADVLADGRLISPNGDGVKDALTIRFTVLRATSEVVEVRDTSGVLVRRSLLNYGVADLGAHSWVWDGRDDGGQPVADGDYRVQFETGFAFPVRVDRTPPAVTAQLLGPYPPLVKFGLKPQERPSIRFSAADGEPGRTEVPHEVVLEIRGLGTSDWRALRDLAAYAESAELDAGALSPELALSAEQLVGARLRVRAVDAAGNEAVAELQEMAEQVILLGVVDGRDFGRPLEGDPSAPLRQVRIPGSDRWQLQPEIPAYARAGNTLGESLLRPHGTSPVRVRNLATDVVALEVQVLGPLEGLLPLPGGEQIADQAWVSLPLAEGGSPEQRDPRRPGDHLLAVDFSAYTPGDELLLRIRTRKADGSLLVSNRMQVQLGGVRFEVMRCAQSGQGTGEASVHLHAPLSEAPITAAYLQQLDGHVELLMADGSRQVQRLRKPLASSDLAINQFLFTLPAGDIARAVVRFTDRLGERWELQQPPSSERLQDCPAPNAELPRLTLRASNVTDLRCGATRPERVQFDIDARNLGSRSSEILAWPLFVMLAGPEGQRRGPFPLPRLSATETEGWAASLEASSSTLIEGTWRAELWRTGDDGSPQRLQTLTGLIIRDGREAEIEIRRGPLPQITITRPTEAPLFCSAPRGELPVLGDLLASHGTRVVLAQPGTGCADPTAAEFSLDCIRLSPSGEPDVAPGRTTGELVVYKWAPPSFSSDCRVNPTRRHCYIDQPVHLVAGAYDAWGGAQCNMVSFDHDAGTSIVIARDAPQRFRNGGPVRSIEPVHWTVRTYEPADLVADIHATQRVPDPMGFARYLPTGDPLRSVPQPRVSGTTGPAEWSPTGLADGVYAVVFRSSDRCAHSASATDIVKVDGTGPQIVIATPEQNLDTRAAVIAIRAAVADWHGGNWELQVSTNNGGSWTMIAEGAVRQVDGPEVVARGTQVRVDWPTRGHVGSVLFRIIGSDLLGNTSEAVRSIQLQPRERLIDDAQLDPPIFSPNADGVLDSTTLRLSLLRPVRLDIHVESADGERVRTLATDRAAGPGDSSIEWNGRGESAVLADGPYRLVVVAEDAEDGSRQDAAELQVVVDTLAPEFSGIFPGNGYANCDESASFTLQDENALSWQAILRRTADMLMEEQGEGSVQRHTLPLRDLDEGELRLVLEAEDVAGNRADESVDFVLDCTPPTLALRQPEPGQLWRGDAGADHAVVGSAEDAHFDHYELWLGTEVPAASEPPAAGTRLLRRGAQAVADGLLHRWLPEVEDGDYVIGLRVRDRARNHVQLWQPLSIDAMPPLARIDAPLEGASVQPQVLVTGIANDSYFRSYQLQIAEAAAAAEGRWSTVLSSEDAVEGGLLGELSLPLEGRYTLRLLVEDASGQQAFDTVTVEVDAVPPPAPQLQGSAGEGRSARLAWSGSDVPDLAGFLLYRDGVAVNDRGSLIADRQHRDVVELDGDYRYTVRAVDRAGNESESSNTVTVRIDRTPPEVSLATPYPGERIRADYAVTGSAHSADDFASWVLRAGIGAAAPEVLAEGASAVRNAVLQRWNTRLIPDESPVTLQLAASDRGGNEATDQAPVVVDNLAPAAPQQVAVAVAADSGVEVTWQPNTEPDLLGYLLYRSGRLISADGATPDDLRLAALTTARFTDSAAPDGELTYRVYAIDLAGNISAPGAPQDIDHESGPPDLDILAPQQGERLDAPVDITTLAHDLDIVEVRFAYRPAAGGPWVPIGDVDTAAPWVARLDPAELPYGDYTLTAVATDRVGLVDPEPPVVDVSVVDLQPPAVPSGLQARADGDVVTLRWSTVGDADLAGYLLQRQGADGNWQTLALDTELTTEAYDRERALGEHVYRVAAYDRFDNRSAFSALATARVHRPALQQPFTPVVADTVDLAGHTAVAGTAEVHHEVDAAAQPLVDAGPVTTGAMSLEGLSLQPGLNRYTLRITDAQQNRSLPTSVRVRRGQRPQPPDALQGSESAGRVTLSWTPPAGDDIAGYRIYRNGQALHPDQPLSADEVEGWPHGSASAHDGDPATAWQVRANPGRVEVQAGLAFYFDSPVFLGGLQLRWRDADSRAVAFELGADSVDGDPVLLRRIDDSRGDRVTLNFTDAYVTSALNLPFQRIALAGGELALAEVTLLGRPLHGDTSIELEPGEGLHRFEVAAVSALGFEGPRSAPWSVGIGDADPPSGVTLQGMLQDRDALLEWTASDAPDLTHYVLRRDGEVIVRVDAAGERRHRDGPLANGRYRYSVAAVDAVGNQSGESNTVELVVQSATAAAPVIERVEAPASGGALLLRWRPGDAQPVVRYDLQRGEAATGPWQGVAEPVGEEYLDRGLVDGRRYYYRLRAIDAAGNPGSWSAPASGVPRRAGGAPRLTWPSHADYPRSWSAPYSAVCGMVESTFASVRLQRGGVAVGGASVEAQGRLLGEGFGDDGRIVSELVATRSGRYALMRDDQATWLHDLLRDQRLDAASLPAGLLAFDHEDRRAIGWNGAGGRFFAVWPDGLGQEALDSFGFVDVTRLQIGAEGRWWWIEGYRNGQTGLWRLQPDSGDVRRVDGEHPTQHSSPARLSHDGGWIYWISSEGELVQADAELSAIRPLASGLRGLAPALAYGRDPLYVLSNDGRQLLRWDPASERVEPAFALPFGARAMALSPDASQLAVQGEDDAGVRLIDVHTGAVLREHALGDDFIAYRLHWGEGGLLQGTDARPSHRVLSPAGRFCVDPVPVLPGMNDLAAVAVEASGSTSAESRSLQVYRPLGSGGHADLEVRDSDLRFLPAAAKPGDRAVSYVTVHNRGDRDVPLTLVAKLLGPDGSERTLAPSDSPATLAGNSSRVLALPMGPLTDVGTWRLQVNLDPDQQVVEARDDNNSASASLQVTERALPRLSLRASNAVADASRPASGWVELHNPGPRFDGRLRLDVVDNTGEPVETLSSTPIEALAFGASQRIAWQWTGAAVLAGSYRLRAVLDDIAGAAVDGGELQLERAGLATVHLQLRSDRGSYVIGDTVRVDLTLAYVEGNRLLPGSRVELDLISPSGHRETLWNAALGTLQRGQNLRRTVGLASALREPGLYRIEARFTADGLAIAADTHLSLLPAGAVPELRGRLMLDPDGEWVLGRETGIGATVSNAGSVAIPDALVRVSLVDAATGMLLLQRESRFAIGPGTEQAVPAIDLAPFAVAGARLVARLDSRSAAAEPWQNLDQRSLQAVDRLPPDIQLLAPTLRPTRTPSLLLARMTDRHSTLRSTEYQIDGDRWRPLQAQAAGDVGDTLRDLADGPHRLLLRATDAWGNEATSGPHDIVVDNTAPRIQIDGVVDGQLGNLPVTPRVGLIDAHPETLAISLNGQPFDNGRVLSEDGAYDLQVEASDLAGNRASRQLHFRIDRTAPAIEFLLPGEGEAVQGERVDVVVRSEPAAMLTLRSGEWVMSASADNDGLARFAAVPLMPGANQLEAEALDEAGNRSEPVRRSLTRLGESALVARILANPLRQEMHAPVGYRLEIVNRGTAALPALPLRLRRLSAAGVESLVELGSPAMAMGATHQIEGESANLTDALGAIQLSLQAQLGASWQELAVATVQVVDTQPPALSWQQPGARSLHAAAINLRVAALDQGSGVAAVQLSIDGRPGSVMASLGGDRYAARIDGLDDGDYVAQVTARDRAGNQQQASPLPFAVDTTPPTIRIDGVSDGAVLTEPVLPRIEVDDRHPGSWQVQLNEQPYSAGTAINVDGPQLLRVTTVDAVGNRSERTLQFTLDLGPPTLLVTEPADGSSTAAARVLLRGRSKPAVRVDLVHESGAASTMADAGGHFVFAEVPLEVGDNTLRLVAEDGAGRRSAELSVRVRREPATGRLQGELAVTPQRLAVGEVINVALRVWHTGAATRIAYPLALRLLAEEGGDPLHNDEFQRDIAAGQGHDEQRSFTTTGRLPGRYRLQLVDRDGPPLMLAEALFVLHDGQPPRIAILDPAADSRHAESVPLRLSASDTDAGPLRVESRIDEGPWFPATPLAAAKAERHFLANLPAPAEGRRRIDARVTDADGLTSPMVERWVVIDRTAPAIRIDGVEADGRYGSSRTIVVEATDEGPASLTVWLNDEPVADRLAVQAEGHHRLRALAVDAAGNRSERSLAFEIDRTAPDVVFVQPLDGSRLQLASTAVEGRSEPLAQIDLRGADWARPLQADASGRFVAPNVPLSLGVNRLTAVAADALGNVGAPASLTLLREAGATTLSGRLRVSDRLMRGDLLQVALELENTGSEPIDRQPIRLWLRPPGSVDERLALGATVSLPAGGRQVMQFEATSAEWALGWLTLRLLSEANGRWIGLDNALVRIDPAELALWVDAPRDQAVTTSRRIGIVGRSAAGAEVRLWRREARPGGASEEVELGRQHADAGGAFRFEEVALIPDRNEFRLQAVATDGRRSAEVPLRITYRVLPTEIPTAGWPMLGALAVLILLAAGLRASARGRATMLPLLLLLGLGLPDAVHAGQVVAEPPSGLVPALLRGEDTRALVAARRADAPSVAAGAGAHLAHEPGARTRFES